MANGTISGGSYNARYSYYMTWSSVANTSANTSNVTLNWIFKKTASDSYNAYNTSGTSKVTLTINGTGSGAMRADFDLRSASVGTTSTIATFTLNNVPHNSDGTCTINVSGSHNTGLNWGTFSIGSTSITLDKIARASDFTISKTSGGSAASSFALGEAIYVNITRASSNFNHKVYFNIGSSSNQSLSTSATTSANGTISDSLATYIPSSSGTATMYVETYNGSTSSPDNKIGTKTQTFTITVPSSVKATIGTITCSDTSGYYSTYNAYVQGKSDLKVSVPVTAAAGSSISNVTVNIKDGTTLKVALTASKVSSNYEATLTDISYVANSLTVEIVAKDSRNRTTTKTTTIKVVAYSNPTATMTAERRNNDATVTLTWSASITNINSANANAKSFKIYKRQKGTSSWGSAIYSSTSSYTYSSNGSTTSCDADYAWEFKIEATDSFTTTTYTTEVGTAFELVNWGSAGNSMAIGKVASDANTFDVGLATKMTTLTTSGAVTINGTLTQNANIAIASGKYIYGSHGGSWYQGRKYAIAYNSHSSGNSYRPVCCAKSSSGDWSIGTYGGDNVLYAVYTTDSNYSSGTNTTTQVQFPTSAGTLALTSNIKTKTSQLTNDSGFITSSSLPSVTNGTFTITKSSGNSAVNGTPSYAKYGNVVMLQMSFKTSASVSAGSNAFVGKISGVSKPKIDSARGCGFYSSSTIVWQINAAGELTVRVLSANISSGQTFTVSGTYVCA